MIKTRNAKNIFENNLLTFTSSKAELSTDQKNNLAAVHLFNLEFGSSVYEFEKKLFFKLFSELLISKYELYFFFIEKTPETITKRRSYKKLLYPYRNEIGKSNLFEKEFEVGSNKSLLYSAILVNENNVKYVCENLIDSRFSFAMINNHEVYEKNILTNISLEKMLKSYDSNSNVIDLNILKVVHELVKEHTSIIRKFADGHDNEILNIFYKNDQHIELVKQMGITFKIK